MYTKVVHIIIKTTHADVFILPTTAPEISAPVKPQKVNWKIINKYSGIVPDKLLIPIPVNSK